MRGLKLFSVLMVIGMLISVFTLRSAYGNQLYPALVVFCGFAFVFGLERFASLLRRFKLWPAFVAKHFQIESIWTVPAWKASLFGLALFGAAWLIGGVYA